MSLFKNDIPTDPVHKTYTRQWLISSTLSTIRYIRYLQQDNFEESTATTCIADGGGPLLWFDRTSNLTFLIGIVWGHKPHHRCGYVGTDYAISTIAFYGWITNLIGESLGYIPNPLLSKRDPVHPLTFTTEWPYLPFTPKKWPANG